MEVGSAIYTGRDFVKNFSREWCFLRPSDVI
jgi:hypothetical protein